MVSGGKSKILKGRNAVGNVSFSSGYCFPDQIVKSASKVMC